MPSIPVPETPPPVVTPTTPPISPLPTTTSSAPPPDKPDEFEEVTETRIVGITETGVIRKRSFKRKVRKEDKSKRGYGHNQDEYDAIRRRVLDSKMASESVANLATRFKMIQMMHEDCMDLVQDWKVTREKRIAREQGHDLEGTLLAVGGLILIVWIVCHWWLL